MESRNSAWGYRIDRPAPVGHYWQWVSSWNVVKVQPVCGCMLPIHELQVELANRPVRRPCPVCCEVSGNDPQLCESI